MQRVATDAVEFTSDMSEDEFRRDLRTLRAVVMSLFLVGELAATVMNDDPVTASNNPDVPWHAMRGMRNRIAHNYFSLEIDIIWQTVRDHIPALIETLRRIGRLA